MIKLHKHNTIDDILGNKRLKELFGKTEELFKQMCESKKSPECVFCGRKYMRSNFPVCKSCKKPNLLIKYGFVGSGVISGYDGGY